MFCHLFSIDARKSTTERVSALATVLPHSTVPPGEATVPLETIVLTVWCHLGHVKRMLDVSLDGVLRGARVLHGNMQHVATTVTPGECDSL